MCQTTTNTTVTPSPPVELPLSMSPPKELAGSSPSQKRPAADFIDPLANKKPRISHLANKAGPVNGKLSSSNGKEVSLSLAAGDGISASSQLPLLDIPRPFDPLSDVSNDSSHNGRDCEGQEAAVAERLSQPPVLSSSAAVSVPGLGPSSPGHTGLDRPKGRVISPSLHGKSKKKSKKHKDKEKTKEREVERRGAEERVPEPRKACDSFPPSPENMKGSSVPFRSADRNGVCNISVPSSSTEMADYLSKYTVIGSSEQRQTYKNDFNTEYSEYRDLHARIEGITRQFTVLDSELKQLQQGTDKYKTIHNQILEEYRKIKKTNPNYSQEKNRCEYLHNKLAHIKKLIAEYDQQQLQNWH
ncbi:hypothetical protein UPYG_G00035120 [Umbra pygmaea]|uniref:OCEL domain-containing protein n=1 Tax=Umbra pygmaea TaxID=75934 RepID=A0ABD0XNN3_UMBPY